MGEIGRRLVLFELRSAQLMWIGAIRASESSGRCRPAIVTSNFDLSISTDSLRCAI
jgi:hypothetical protein